MKARPRLLAICLQQVPTSRPRKVLGDRNSCRAQCHWLASSSARASLRGAAMLFEQLLGMRARFDGDLGARQHAGELVDTLRGFQPFECRRDRCAVADLRHTKVMI